MKKVLIQLGTEFHYMVALSLIDKYYTGDEFDIHFIIANPGANTRLSQITLDPSYTYHDGAYNHHVKKVFPDVVALKQFIETNEFHHFVSFLYHDPLFVYLTYYFKNRNTTTFLAPDGMAAYVKFIAKNYRDINGWQLLQQASNLDKQNPLRTVNVLRNRAEVQYWTGDEENAIKSLIHAQRLAKDNNAMSAKIDSRLKVMQEERRLRV